MFYIVCALLIATRTVFISRLKHLHLFIVGDDKHI
jgi:hypothetical protein